MLDQKHGAELRAILYGHFDCATQRQIYVNQVTTRQEHERNSMIQSHLELRKKIHERERNKYMDAKFNLEKEIWFEKEDAKENGDDSLTKDLKFLLQEVQVLTEDPKLSRLLQHFRERLQSLVINHLRKPQPTAKASKSTNKTPQEISTRKTPQFKIAGCKTMRVNEARKTSQFNTTRTTQQLNESCNAARKDATV